MHGDDVVVLLDGDDDVDAMARVDSPTPAHNKTPGACSWQSSIVELNNSDAGNSTEAELVAKSKKNTRSNEQKYCDCCYFFTRAELQAASSDSCTTAIADHCSGPDRAIGRINATTLVYYYLPCQRRPAVSC